MVIAVLGLIGSLGVAWISTGASFSRALEAKSVEIGALTAKFDALQDRLATAQTFEGRLAQIETTVERSKLEGFGAASADGVKACLIGVDSRWLDTVTLPRSATAKQCDELRVHVASGGKSSYSLGCVFPG